MVFPYKVDHVYSMLLYNGILHLAVEYQLKTDYIAVVGVESYNYI